MKLLRISLLAITIILVCASKTSGLVYTSRSFATRSHVCVYVPAKRGGETAGQILRHEAPYGAVYAVDCMYYDPASFLSIGNSYCYPDDLTQLPCSYKRAYIAQYEEDVLFSRECPTGAYCYAQCGMMLIENGVVMPYSPEGDERGHYKSRGKLRTIATLTGKTINYIKTKGSLPDIAWYFRKNKKHPCFWAVSFDGGRSTPWSAKLAGAWVVYHKDRYLATHPGYRAYLEKKRAIKQAAKFIEELCRPTDPFRPFGLDHIFRQEPPAYEPWDNLFTKGK